MKRLFFLALALAIVLLSVPSASAAPVGSPYRSAMAALAPTHYYPLDEPYGSDPTTTPAQDFGSAAVNGTYYGLSANYYIDPLQGGEDDTAAQTKAYIGSNIGPQYISNEFSPMFSNPQALIDAQLAGFGPNLTYNTTTPDNSTPNVNRVFEMNARGGVIAPKATFLGGSDGGFTVAMWVKLNDNVLASPGSARIFDSGVSSNTDPGFFQVIAGRYAGITVVTGGGGKEMFFSYPSGGKAWQYDPPATAWAPGSNSHDYYVSKNNWHFIVATTYGTTSAEKFNNLTIWERYADKTKQFANVGGGWSVQSGDPAVIDQAKFGFYRTSSTGVPSQDRATHDKMDELATWNRALQYDEIESLYLAATMPLAGAPVNTSTTDGNWASGAGWTLGNWPMNRGSNNRPYEDVVINSNITADYLGISNPTSETATMRSNMYRLTVNATKTLTLGAGATLRTAEDMAINGSLAMNGNGGNFAVDNWPQAAKLDSGRHLTVAPGTTITMASPSNQLMAEGNLTITGSNLVVNPGTNFPASGAKLFTIAQADSNGNAFRSASLQSALDEPGVLTGKFASVTLNQPADALGRKFSILYEGRVADGSGTVDSVKVGFAKPGDADFNNSVDVLDVNALVPNFGGANKNWRQGDFDNTGGVDVLDVNALRPNFNQAYALSKLDDGYLKVDYNAATGALTLLDTAPPDSPFPLDGVTIQSASGILDPSKWLGPNTLADLYTGTPQVIGFNAWFSGTTVSSPFSMGNILPPGLSEQQLRSDLTVTYFRQGDNTQYMVPEPSTWLLLLAAAGGLAVGLRRRRVQPE